jgi:mRNA interferase MazF
MSCDDPAPPRAIVIYVPITSQNRGTFYEVSLPMLPYLNEPSFANVQGIGSIATARLQRRLGMLPPPVLQQIKVALMRAMSLQATTI